MIEGSDAGCTRGVVADLRGGVQTLRPECVPPAILRQLQGLDRDHPAISLLSGRGLQEGLTPTRQKTLLHMGPPHTDSRYTNPMLQRLHLRCVGAPQRRGG